MAETIIPDRNYSLITFPRTSPQITPFVSYNSTCTGTFRTLHFRGQKMPAYHPIHGSLFIYKYISAQIKKIVGSSSSSCCSSSSLHSEDSRIRLNLTHLTEHNFFTIPPLVKSCQDHLIFEFKIIFFYWYSHVRIFWYMYWK